ncbi:MAG: TPM domain-containing protein [Phycisphaeraceae bacterium]
MMLMMSVMSAAASGAQQGDGSAKSYAPYPQPDHGYVTDLAKVLGAQREEAIEQKLYATEKDTGVEIAVVTIDSMSDYPGTPRDIEAFARGLFDVYGVGNMPANNGVLLVVAVKDRKLWITLGAGYGRQHDGAVKRIVDNRIIPRFKQNDYADGIEAGVDAIVAQFAPGSPVSGAAFEWRDLLPLLWWTLGITAVTLIVVSLIRNGKRGWGWVVAGLLIVIVLAVMSAVVYVMTHRSSGGGRGLGSSSSWSSGGFGGGFGGGFSGGGGAGGSW